MTAPTLEVKSQSLITIPPDSAFYAYRCSGASAGDVSGDPVTGNTERDMVGDSTHPAFFRAADATHVFFRMRIDSSPLKNNGVDLQPSSWDVLVDTDGNLKTYEFMLTADGNISGTKVQWVRNSVQEPTNPRDPAVDNKTADLLENFTPVTDYYNVKQAADGSNFNGTPDFFVTLVIPKATLQAAGLNLNNSFVVWGGTNAQNYSLNADFGCSVGMPGSLDVVAPEPGPLDPAGTPNAIDDTVTVAEDASVTTAVLTNDTGLRDGPHSVTIIKQPLYGTLTVNADNTVTYTPAANYNGPDSYTYQVRDADGQVDTAVVSVAVTPVNDNPTGVDDTFSVPTTSTGTTLDVLTNDSNLPDSGETLAVSAVTQPASGGTVTIAAGGTGVVFTPTPGFTGPVTFTYTVEDSNGGTDVVSVTVNVLAAGNNPPVANNDTFEVNEDSAATPLDVLANDTTDVGEDLKVVSITQPAIGGTVTFADYSVSFTPAPNFNGDVTFSYVVSDGNGGTDTATVTVKVLPVNDPPTAVDDTVSMPEDSGATVVDVLANDTFAPDTGETLSVQSVTQPATGGTVTLVNGVVRFTPAPNFHGEVKFDYTVSDGKGGTSTATVTVNVTSVNDLPTGGPDTFPVPAGSGATPLDVLANDTMSPDTGEELSITAVTQPASGGTVTISPDGKGLVFTPAPGFTGSVIFEYTLSDGNGGTVTVPVTVNVTVPGNTPPTAVDDEVTLNEDSATTVVDVLTNDTIAPDTGETLSVLSVTQPARGGTVTLDGNVVRFTPDPDFNGDVTFSYTLSDGRGGTDTATVTVHVTSINDLPIGGPDTYSVTEGSGATTFPVLNNDSSGPDTGETLSVTAVTQPTSGGTVSVSPDGKGVVFTPAPGFSGPVAFTYTLSDGNGGTVAVPVNVNVIANTPPTAVDDEVTLNEDSVATVVNVLANDTFAPDTGETLSVQSVTQPARGGTVTLVDGVVRFTPAPDFNGDVTFSYTLSDGRGGTDTATVTVHVTSINDLPIGVPDTYSVLKGSGATTLPVLNNDSIGPDTGETLNVAAVTQPASGGTVTVSPDGKGVVFTPTPGFSGPVTFTYTLSDGNGGTVTVPVTVNVGVLDSDGDGLEDPHEEELGTDPRNPDTDGDGLPDGLEVRTGTNPRDDDTDDDGLTDGNEDRNHNGIVEPGETNPRGSDTDGDGLGDGLESGLTQPQGKDTHPSRFTPDADPSTTTDPLNPDSDGDGLKDGVEDADQDGRAGDQESDPNDADTDDGGLMDGEEVNAGGNPRDYADDLSVVGRGCSSTGAGTLLPLLLLLAVPLMRRRQALRGSGMTWALLGLLAAVSVSAPAIAQPASQAIDVQQYKPGPSSRDVLGLHSSQVGKHLDWNLGLSFNYARDPLNFLRPRTDDFIYAIVQNQFTFDLMGSVALFDRFELGVALPITTQGSASAASVSPLLSDGLQATGVGDLRLVPKVGLLSLDSGLHLGLAVPVLLPTSGGKEFLGRQGVAAFPRLLGEWVLNDQGVRVLANVGVNLQPRAQFYNLNVGNEFAYGLGTEVPFKLSQHRLAAEATLVGAVGLNQRNTEERPLELLGAVKYHLTDSLAAHMGGGPGLTRGYGTPGFRLFAGVVWTEATRAVVARIEPPPPAPAPAPVDSDGDGLTDENDRCPSAAETRNDFEDADGCPDEVPPPPPVDSDGDGLTDDKDRCPQAAEDKDGYQDADGCPDPDNDKDGVTDANDKCPTEPEVINGVQDDDGCPDKGKEKVRVEGQRIVILDKVYFATNKDVILQRSFPLLRQVGQVLRANPQLTKVRVEGHTDNKGNDAFNLDLSQRRANSVRKHLIEKEGIAAERLEAVGYGETKPVSTNATAAGRENNRRVEFTILEVKE